MKPDVVVLDVAMPLVNGIEAAARIAESHPSVGVLMLTADESPATVKTALRAGARDYLSKTSEMERLCEAVLKLAARGDRGPVERGPGFVWSFYGTKGGAGTTTLAVNTAVALSRLGHRVALVDMDLLHGDCGFYLDLPPPSSERSLLARLGHLEALDAELVALSMRRVAVGADAPPLDLLESPGRLLAAGEHTERDAALFLESAEAHVAALGEAARRGDARAVQLAAHTLKGTSANIGARRFQALAAQLDALARAGTLDEALADELAIELARVREALGVGDGI